MLACGGTNYVAPPDGGDAQRLCVGTRLCDGLSVKACDNGNLGKELDNCEEDGACSLQRCTSLACGEAERDHNGFAGCLFYTVQVDNVTSDATAPTSFLVTNPGREAAEVTLELHAAGSWTPAGNTTVAPGSAARLPIAGLQVDMSGLNEKGLRLDSSQPVTVAQIHSDDGNRDAYSSGGTMVLPVHALGRRHLVMAYPQVQTPALASIGNSIGGAGRLLVVGTEAGTSVTVHVAKNASLVVAGSLATVMPGPDGHQFQLGDGEVFQAWSGDDKQDLSGTEIVASAPVAVFSGNIATTYGKASDGINSPDMAHEQIPPIAHWSHRYVAAALRPQAATCDTLLGPAGASLWRLLAFHEGTHVAFMGPDHGTPVHDSTTMGAGAVIEIVTDSDFVVTADWPLLVTQGIDCEPSLSLAIPADKLLEDVTFSVLPRFDHMVAVVRMGNDPVILDNTPINNELFSPAGGGYEVARVPLEECPPSKQVCTHRLKGRFGMTLRGMDVLASYALTLPASMGCNDPLDVACVN